MASLCYPLIIHYPSVEYKKDYFIDYFFFVKVATLVNFFSICF